MIINQTRREMAQETRKASRWEFWQIPQSCQQRAKQAKVRCMTIAIPLSKNDIRQLAHGYIWISTQELFKTKSPDFSQAEEEAFDHFLASGGRAVNNPSFQVNKIEMTTSALTINSEVILEGTQNIARLIQCAQLFLEELKENPKEVEAVSCVPFSNLPDLVSRLKALQTPEGKS